MFKYIVQPTDTLHFIALKFNIPVKELAYTNNLIDLNDIQPGQSLVIPSPSNNRHSGLPQLYPGCRDDSFIVLLQSQLSKLGYYSDDIDGTFNCMTHRAVMAFQMDKELHPSGFVDQVTWAELFESAKISYDLPNYKARLISPGILLILSSDRRSYKPGDVMKLTLFEINLTAKPLIFTYGTSQRYDFEINDCHGSPLWKWSDDQVFSRTPDSVCLSPYKTISHTVYIELSTLLEHKDLNQFWATGWNTPFQTHMVKVKLPLIVQGQS